MAADDCQKSKETSAKEKAGRLGEQNEKVVLECRLLRGQALWRRGFEVEETGNLAAADKLILSKEWGSPQTQLLRL